MFLDNGIIQMGDRPLGHNRAAIHDVKTVADAKAKIQILFDQQNADLALLLDLEQRLADEVNDVGLDALGRFVQQQELSGWSTTRGRWPIAAAGRR